MKRWFSLYMLICLLPAAGLCADNHATFLPAEVQTVDLWQTDSRTFVLADDPQGVRRLYILTPKKDGFDVLQSAPVPSTAFLDPSHSSAVDLLLKLNAEGDYCYLSPTPDGSTWYVNFVGLESWYELGWDHITDPSREYGPRHYGSHPWSDIRTADLIHLPKTSAEALDVLDSSGWAVVDSGAWNECVRLSVQPEDAAAYVGEYYTGTGLRVLAEDGAWTQVEIAGVRGWVPSARLIRNDAMAEIAPEFPDRWQLSFIDAVLSRGIPVYTQPLEDAKIVGVAHSDGIDIIGRVRNEWFHVVFHHEGLQGYVKQDCFWPGNG